MALLASLRRWLYGERPRAGQLWRSPMSGKAVLIDRIQIQDAGTPFIHVRHELEDGVFNDIPDLYAVGWHNWRARRSREGRYLDGEIGAAELQRYRLAGWQPWGEPGPHQPPPREL